MTSGPFVHLNTNSDWGGGETQILLLLRELKSRNVAARLFAHPDGRLLKVAREEQLDAHPLPYSVLGKSARGAKELANTLRHHAPSLLHAHDSGSTTLAVKCGRALSIPAIMTRRVSSPIRNNWFSQRKYSPTNLAAIACISETVRTAMKDSSRYPESHLHLIPSACDVESLQTIAPLSEFDDVRPAFRVGGVGKLSLKKNWALMIRTAAVLNHSEHNIHWYLAGTGSEESALRSLAQELAVSERVHFLGFRDDAAAVTRSMDAYFFPSIMEGAGISVFEAMAMGIPVISADAPGTVETLNGHGWLVGADDAEGAAAALTEALTDSRLREQKTSAAMKRMKERHSINAMADAYVELYARLTQAAPGS